MVWKNNKEKEVITQLKYLQISIIKSNTRVKHVILTVFTVLFVVYAGFIGITFYFSDYGPGESMLSRQVIAFVFYVICGLLIAWIRYPRKKTTYLLLWGVTIVACLSLPQALKEGVHSLWQIPVMVLVPFLGVSLSQVVISKIRK